MSAPELVMLLLLQACINITSALQHRKYTQLWSGSHQQPQAAVPHQLSRPPKPKAARANPSRTRPAKAAALTRQLQQQQHLSLTLLQQLAMATRKQPAVACHQQQQQQQGSTLCPRLVLVGLCQGLTCLLVPQVPRSLALWMLTSAAACQHPGWVGWGSWIWPRCSCRSR
jgi:hypothetical protein